MAKLLYQYADFNAAITIQQFNLANSNLGIR